VKTDSKVIASAFLLSLLNFQQSSFANILVSRISVSGCLDDGIELPLEETTIVESCMARTSGGTGIKASTVKNSAATDCGLVAIYGQQVSDCLGECGGAGIGVNALVAQNCYGRSTSGIGVLAFTAQNCVGTTSTGTGLYASTAQNRYGSATAGGYGLYASDVASVCHGRSFSGMGLYAFIAHVCRGSTTSGTALSTTHNVNSY